MNQLAMPLAESERWLPVVGWEGLYEVSSLGRVRSLPGMSVARLLKPIAPGRRNPYPRVTLIRSAYRRPLRVHLLVARAFLGPCPPGQEVRHGPGGRLDNRLVNLSYGTRAQNLGPDKRRDGTSNAGTRNCNAKLTDEIVRECRLRAVAGESASALAAEFGVCVSTMRQAVIGETWKHLASAAG